MISLMYKFSNMQIKLIYSTHLKQWGPENNWVLVFTQSIADIIPDLTHRRRNKMKVMQVKYITKVIPMAS